MSDSINFFESLLNTARQLANNQQTRRAIAALRRLTAFPNLPESLACESLLLLGELYLRHRAYRRARQYLSRAARRDRTSARAYFLLGLACHHDPRGDLDRAARFYARSLRLAPRQIRCLGEAGLLAIYQGADDEGLALLRNAVELAPNNTAATIRLCQGLRRAGQPDEALRTLRLAQFRAPHSTALRSLSAEILLDRLRSNQECDATAERMPQSAVILPFLQVVRSHEQESEVRLHAPHQTSGPHLMRLHHRRIWRKAP